jgi:hypothetical protein
MTHKPSMRLYLGRAVAVLAFLTANFLVATSANAQLTPIPVLNPTFNIDSLPCGPGSGCNSYGITGWITGPQTYVLKASTTQFPTVPVTGLYVGVMGNSTSSGSILQTVGATVQPNTTYVLSVTVGARADEVFTGYRASLMAGNVTLISGHQATPVGGIFVTETLVYESGPTPAQLGIPLQIFIQSLGNGQAVVSNVALAYEPTTPPPAQ